MRIIGSTIDIVIEVPNEVYDKYVKNNNINDVYSLVQGYMDNDLTIEDGIKLRWYELTNAEII